MALILDPLSQLPRAVALLRQGFPVALPTETVYGLAAQALRPESLARVFALKARPSFDPLIVHVLAAEGLAGLARVRFETERKLLAAFWPGPLTLLLPREPSVPDLCTSGLPSVAVRAPSHPVFRSLLELLGEPLAAPSANRFGRLSPTSADDVVEELGPHGLEAVVDGGRCEHGIESTIARVESEALVRVLRPGALALERIRELLGPDVRVELQASSSSPGKAAEAPGTLESHYAPRSPLRFVETGEGAPELPGFANAAIVTFRPELPSWAQGRTWSRHEILSPYGSDREAAARLFSVLRALDGADLIVCEALPESGLGLAVNDRLRRAGATRPAETEKEKK